MNKNVWLRNTILAGFSAVALVAGTGCQVDIGGQTLPSPFYMSDDVQYYAEGPEFKLQREADAMQAFRTEQTATDGF